ncbi:hypothetical protein ACLB1O_21445 [Escherichia coli]
MDTTECWPLRSDSTWHGFKNIDNEHMYLDPIKVTLLTPGMEKDGTISDFGIPASIIANTSTNMASLLKPVRVTCCSCSASVSIRPKH